VSLSPFRRRGHNRLTAETSSVPTRARRASLPRERAQLLDHGVERFLQQQDFAAHVTVIFFDRSPLAMASRPRRFAHLRVKFEAMK